MTKLNGRGGRRRNFGTEDQEEGGGPRGRHLVIPHALVEDQGLTSEGEEGEKRREGRSR
jgi:hypothetical protein